MSSATRAVNGVGVCLLVLCQMCWGSIRIGAPLPLSGAFSTNGNIMYNAARMYERMVNANGYVIRISDTNVGAPEGATRVSQQCTCGSRTTMT
jgi:hypothetical protein